MPSRDVAALVLAAGHGTRIAQLSARRPKPLLPMGLGTPLGRAVERLRAAGIEHVVVNASHRADDVVVAGRALGVQVVVEKDGPLGTAGGLSVSRDVLDARRVVVWNGDIVADVDVRALARALDRESDAAAVLAVRGRLPRGEGNVGVDADGAVVRLRDARTFGPEDHGAWFCAVHVLGPTAIARAPSRGCLVADVYHPLLAEGARLSTREHAGRWHDVGDLASYLAANLDLIEAGPALVGDGAHVDSSVELQGCVIGAGSRVTGVGKLCDVVVWPGAPLVVSATQPLAGAIVLDDGTILPVPEGSAR